MGKIIDHMLCGCICYFTYFPLNINASKKVKNVKFVKECLWDVKEKYFTLSRKCLLCTTIKTNVECISHSPCSLHCRILLASDRPKFFSLIIKTLSFHSNLRSINKEELSCMWKYIFSIFVLLLIIRNSLISFHHFRLSSIQ